MIHYAFNFCQAVEDSQGVDENLIQAVHKMAGGMYTDLILKTRDSLRELAKMLEEIAVKRDVDE